MNLPKPLECSEVGRVEVLEKLINHELDPEFEDRILGHLRNCPGCLSVLASVLYETIPPEARLTLETPIITSSDFPL